MLVDALQLLSADGFPIRDYQYTSMGSVYFVDFVLFHKLLGIDKLVSVEYAAEIQKRIAFNRPFGLVQIHMGRIGDYIPSLSPDRRHILWLDYDRKLNAEILSDIRLAGTYLTPGSVILVTVNTEPPGSVLEGGNPDRWREYFRKEARDFLDPSLGSAAFTKTHLPALNAAILEAALRGGMAGRGDLEFLPIFYFVYADSALMLTVGGMLGDRSQRRRLRGCQVREAVYYREDLRGAPFQIVIPKVTRKERLALDSSMPCPDGWLPTEFEVDAREIQAYRDIYRFLPAYAELLL